MTTNPIPTSPEPVRDELDQEGLERAAQENYRKRIKQQFGQDPGGMIGTRIGFTIPWDQLGEKFKQQEREATRAAILAYREWEREHWTIATEHLVARLPVLGQCEALLRCYPAQLPRCTSKAAFRRDGHIVCGSHMRTASNLYTEPKAPDHA